MWTTERNIKPVCQHLQGSSVGAVLPSSAQSQKAAPYSPTDYEPVCHTVVFMASSVLKIPDVSFIENGLFLSPWIILQLDQLFYNN